MTWRTCGLTVGLVLALAGAAPAAGIFGKAKPNPADRVPQLLGILKGDPAERKRESAAKELRDFDGAAFPEIIPALVEALRNDAKAGVRAEAAESLGKLRPVNPAAGQALEQAMEKDASLRVRLQARRSLLNYRIGGYFSKGKVEEPPAAPATSVVSEKKRLTPTPTPRSRPGSNPAETAPPPLAEPEGELRLQPVPPGQPVPAPPLIPPTIRTTDQPGPAPLPPGE